jgi:hypothetical protein
MQTTKFKAGDEVWDSVHYPKQKGIVDEIDICEDDCCPIHVIFNNNSYVCYNINASLSNNGTAISTLSLTPYEVEFKGFTQDRPKVLTDEIKVCCVGKKIEYKGSIFLILQQDKESVDILLDGRQEIIMIDDITNGKYRIIE